MVMVRVRVRRACARAGRRGACAAALLAALCACALLPAPRAPAPLLTEARFPHVAPRALAHALADFTNHPRLYPHLGEWTVEAESGNYSAWRYEVSYDCGPRCWGRARVLALDAHAAAGAADSHTVIVAHRTCTRAPLLRWPSFCDEWETEAAVRSDGGGGAVLRETARGVCGAGAGPLAVARLLWRRVLAAPAPAPADSPGCGLALQHARDEHLRRLRLLLHTQT